MSASTHSLIQQRALEIYIERQRAGRPGDALADWLTAEREIHTPTPTKTASRRTTPPRKATA